jgi:uncharacterized membrane protein YfcA
VPHRIGLGTLILLLPLGLVAGLLSGLLGIGGGLVFAPLLLAMGLSPHAALATSTVAIVPTTLGGTWAHLRTRTLPLKGGVSISAGAAVAGGLFSHLGVLLSGWHLLALQALMYALIALTFAPPAPRPEAASADPGSGDLVGLAVVGLLAGLASGMLGIGGGILMVPLMVRLLAVPVHQAVGGFLLGGLGLPSGWARPAPLQPAAGLGSSAGRPVVGEAAEPGAGTAAGCGDADVHRLPGPRERAAGMAAAGRRLTRLALEAQERGSGSQNEGSSS